MGWAKDFLPRLDLKSVGFTETYKFQLQLSCKLFCAVLHIQDFQSNSWCALRNTSLPKNLREINSENSRTASA